MTEVDAIVNCCGFTNLAWIEDQPLASLRQTVEVNLIGAMQLTAEFVRQTITNRYLKHVIHIGSMAYNHVLNASAPYCASKAGLAHFVNCAAYELTPKGYRVHCVHPSNTEGTPMTAATIQGIMRYRNISSEEAVMYWAASNQMDRWLQPEDIANAVRWLLSDQADFWSGQQVELKGGNR
jgi:NAD(P)-dependent dehydrogenase (short-subunit alcohol dehydrogenase family)